MNRGMEAIARFIREHDDFLVTAHSSPDGDAIGSMSALAWLLRCEGKNVRLYNASPMPDDLAWLELCAPYVTCLEDLGDFQPRAAILVDCSESARVGGDLAETLDAGHIPALAVIDHHLVQPQKADAAWVKPDAASSSLLVGQLARSMGHTLNGGLGESVYLGLVADTGSFSFSNTNAEAFEMARLVVEAGLDVGAFTEQRDHVWSLEKLRLWGELANRIQLFYGGKLACLAVPKALLERYGQDGRALEGFSSRMRTIRGVRASILVREGEGGKSKASLRSGAGVDVRAIAQRAGGGGHEHAAGVTMDADADVLLAKLVELAGEVLAPFTCDSKSGCFAKGSAQ